MYPILQQKGFYMKLLKNWIADGCLYYTLISGTFLLIAFLSESADSAIATSSFLLMIPCGLTVSIGTQILRNLNLSTGFRFFFHYFFTVVGLFVFLVLPAGDTTTAMTKFMMVLLLSVIYWIIFVIVYFAHKRYKKLMKN